MARWPEPRPEWWMSGSFDGRPMSEILSARDVSTVFRFLKTRGFSRSAIAAATGLSETRVREIIQGRQRVRDYQVFERIASGLAIDRGLLGLAFGGTPLAQATAERCRQPVAELADRDLAEHWGELLTVLAERSNERGAASVWSLTRRQLTVIDMHRQSRPDSGGGLLSVQARWSEFASWVADNLGRHGEARRWTELALSQATEAGDSRTIGYVLMRQAQQSAEQHWGVEAVDLAEKAMSVDSGGPRTAALCLVRQAHGHALARDARACRAAAGQAVRLLERSDDADADPLDRHCTNLYVAAYEGLCRLLVGDPDGAVGTLEGVLAAWPDGMRQDEVMWRAWLADAYLVTGRKPEAGAEAVRALELVQMTGSVRARTVLDAVAGRLVRDDRVVEVGQFLAAHRVATAASRR